MVNLMSIDWSVIGSEVYDIPRNMILQISERAANLLHIWMLKMKIEPMNVHFLGYSLGAHIAGNMGKYFNGSIGR